MTAYHDLGPLMRCCQIGYFNCWHDKLDAAARSTSSESLMQGQGKVTFEPRIVMIRSLWPMREHQAGSTYSSLGECNSPFHGFDSLRHIPWATWWIYRSNDESRTGTHAINRLEEESVRPEALEWCEKSSRSRQEHAESWISQPLTASRAYLQTKWRILWLSEPFWWVHIVLPGGEAFIRER